MPLPAQQTQQLERRPWASTGRHPNHLPAFAFYAAVLALAARLSVLGLVLMRAGGCRCVLRSNMCVVASAPGNDSEGAVMQWTPDPPHTNLSWTPTLDSTHSRRDQFLRLDLARRFQGTASSVAGWFV